MNIIKNILYILVYLQLTNRIHARRGTEQDGEEQEADGDDVNVEVVVTIVFGAVVIVVVVVDFVVGGANVITLKPSNFLTLGLQQKK